jgi:hypothetical protein
MDKPIKCRMRTIKDTAKFFREMDPDTEITEFAIRQMIKEGTIPVVKTGIKQLINLDVLLKIFGVETDV